MRYRSSERIRMLRVTLVVAGLALGAAVLSGGCNAIADIQEASQRCANGIADGDESDVDCGGPCAACKSCQFCSSDADCGELVCDADLLLCRDPACDDDEDDDENDCQGDCCQC